MKHAARAVVRLKLGGLVAVHAARAAHTALTAVPGIASATVTMAGAELEVVMPLDLDTLAMHVRAALEPIGMQLTDITLVQRGILPLA